MDGTRDALTWCDGEWTISSGPYSHGAPGVPRAANMREARTVGAAYLARCSSS
jgi:hypothetical protein